MPSRELLHFSAPLRAVRLCPRPGTEDFQTQLLAAERAGYERGVAEGEAALRAQVLSQQTELRERHDRAIQALQQAVPQAVRETEDAMISLALEIAQKLVAALPVTREMVAASVREALEQVEDTAEFSVLLHAEDLELLGEAPVRAVRQNGSHKMRLAASQEVTRGGCLVQTRFGIIDTRRETKLARVAETLGLS